MILELSGKIFLLLKWNVSDLNNWLSVSEIFGHTKLQQKRLEKHICTPGIFFIWNAHPLYAILTGRFLVTHDWEFNQFKTKPMVYLNEKKKNNLLVIYQYFTKVLIWINGICSILVLWNTSNLILVEINTGSLPRNVWDIWNIHPFVLETILSGNRADFCRSKSFGWLKTLAYCCYTSMWAYLKSIPLGWHMLVSHGI